MNYDLPNLTELPGFAWHCAPSEWGFNGHGLFIKPSGRTDFWQRTHYGFSADNGHFLFTRLAGDFVVFATVRSHPCHQYDQAGLMVRQDAARWIKTSAEFEPDAADRLGVVVTHHGFSDWSTQNLPASRLLKNDFSRSKTYEFPKNLKGQLFKTRLFQRPASAGEISFRLVRNGNEFLVSARLAGADWTQLRMVRLDCKPTAQLAVGPYACSPKEAGFQCVFSELSVEQTVA